MTTKPNIRKRLSELEDDTTEDDALGLISVMSSMNSGVDPREQHGGYIPADVAETVRGCFQMDLYGERDEEELTDEEWWKLALDNVELIGEDGA